MPRCLACGTPKHAGERCPVCDFREARELDREPSAVVPIGMIGRAPPGSRLDLGGELGRLLGPVPRGAVVLVGGKPGGGKSTVALAACAHVAPRSSLHVNLEMPPELLRLCAERAGAIALPSVHACDSLSEALSWTAKRRPALVVLDSVSACPHPRAAALELRDAAQRAGAVALVIVHATKAGDLAGLAAMQHDHDATVWLTRSRARVEKSRFGPPVAFSRSRPDRRRKSRASSPRPESAEASMEGLRLPEAPQGRRGRRRSDHRAKTNPPPASIRASGS